MSAADQTSLFDPESLANYPASPGVYIMRNAAGDTLYIGKAANLRQRIRNYFSASGDNRFTVAFIRRHVAAIETIVTANEKEAFLLENTLIKRHQPRYNIRLRDDKTYISLRLRMSHDFPRLETIRVRGNALRGRSRAEGVEHKPERQRRDGDLYFGPYTSASSVRDTLRFLLRVFPVRTCKDSVFRNRTRPCILYDVGKCCGPCTEPVPRKEFLALVEKVAAFLRGKSGEVREALVTRMQELSDAMEFERAALIRDRIAALDTTLERQQAAIHKRDERDVIAVASRSGRSMVVIHQIREGTLVRSDEHYLKNYDQDDSQVLYSFIAQHYDPDGPYPTPPPEVVVTVEPQDCALLEEILRDRRGAVVTIATPQRGERARLARTADINARQALARRLAGEQNEEETLSELQRRLNLPCEPRTVECVDISNIMGVMAVGSLVRFEDTRADKTGYRLYRIRTVEGSNDFAMMREVLSRRFAPGSTTAKPHPDLLMVDGGKGQLGVAEQVFTELGLTDNVMLCAIAKSRIKTKTLPANTRKVDGAHFAAEPIRFRTEERIFLPGRKNPVTFPHNSPALHLLERIRDETHRTAITYHRKIRSKTNRRSVLDEVPGVGPKRKSILLRHFGSLAALRAASEDDIAAVDGMSRAAAENVHRFLHAQENAAAIAPADDDFLTDETEEITPPADFFPPEHADALTPIADAPLPDALSATEEDEAEVELSLADLDAEESAAETFGDSAQAEIERTLREE